MGAYGMSFTAVVEMTSQAAPGEALQETDVRGQRIRVSPVLARGAAAMMPNQYQY